MKPRAWSTAGLTIRFSFCVAAGALAWQWLAGIAMAQSMRAPLFERSPNINDVVHIDPPGRYLPLYQRAHYRQNQARITTVTRFVADKEIDW